MSRATEDLLDSLHGMTAQAINFLKANGVDRAIRPGDPEDFLAKELDDEFGDVSHPMN